MIKQKTNMKTTEEIHREHFNLIHAIQTGNLQLGDQVDPNVKQFKHVRTGVDVAMAGIDAIKEILTSKGIISENDFLEAWSRELKFKVEAMEKRISEHYGGTNIKLG